MIYDFEGKEVAVLKLGGHGKRAFEQNEANGLLMAASPELLWALKWLAEFSGLRQFDPADPSIRRVWKAIEAAERQEKKQ